MGLVTGFTPEGHYSEGLAHAVWGLGTPSLTVLAGRHETLPVHPYVASGWRPGWRFLTDIVQAINAHSIGLVHVQHEFTMFGGGMSVPQVRRLAGRLRVGDVPVITTIHAVPTRQMIDRNFTRAFMGSRAVPAVIVRTLIAWTLCGLCRDSARVIVHTPGLGEILVRDYGADPATLVHIPLGVPVRLPAAPVGRRGGDPLVVCPGYVSRRKGIEAIVAAFGRVVQQIPEARLHLVGGISQPTYARELRELAATVGAAGRVSFTGMVSLARFYGELHDADLVVLGAEYSISASQPLAQAWASNAPVLAPARGAIQELVNDGVDGCLYPAGDSAALASAMVRILRSPDIRAQMAAGSRARASRDSWVVAAHRTVDVYRDVWLERS